MYKKDNFQGLLVTKTANQLLKSAVNIKKQGQKFCVFKILAFIETLIKISLYAGKKKLKSRSPVNGVTEFFSVI